MRSSVSTVPGSRHSVIAIAQDQLDVSCEPAFDFGSPCFESLFARSSASAFQHPIWLKAFQQHLIPDRHARAITVVGKERREGALRFVLPLILRRVNGIDLLESSDLGVSDYAAPVVDRDWWDGQADKDALHRAVRSVLPAHDLMRLRPLRPEHVALWQSLMGGKARPLPFSAHATSLPRSMEMWRAHALDPSFDRYLARKRKRLFKQPDARCRVLKTSEEITTAIAAIARLRAGRFAGDIIQSPAALRFYTQVAVEGGACGQARTYALELGGEAIGYTFALTRTDQLHYLLIGCDYERHGRHSPGLILYDAMIGDWIDQGGTEFDFTIGDEAFKADFGTVATPMSEIVEARSWRGSLAHSVWTLRQAWRTSRPASPPTSGANPIPDTDKER